MGRPGLQEVLGLLWIPVGTLPHWCNSLWGPHSHCARSFSGCTLLFAMIILNSIFSSIKLKPLSNTSHCAFLNLWLKWGLFDSNTCFVTLCNKRRVKTGTVSHICGATDECGWPPVNSTLSVFKMLPQTGWLRRTNKVSLPHIYTGLTDYFFWQGATRIYCLFVCCQHLSTQHELYNCKL